MNRVFLTLWICLAFSLPLYAEDEPSPDEKIQQFFEKTKSDLKKADEMFTSKMIEGDAKASPEVIYLRRQVHLLRVKVEELQLRLRPDAPQFAGEPTDFEVPPSQEEGESELIYLNNGTLSRPRAIRKGNWVYFDEKYYPIAEVYRGMEDGKPIYAHPELPWPKPPTQLVESKQGTTIISQLGTAPYGHIPREKIPKGHYPDLDRATGKVRFLVHLPRHVLEAAEREAREKLKH